MRHPFDDFDDLFGLPRRRVPRRPHLRAMPPEPRRPPFRRAPNAPEPRVTAPEPRPEPALAPRPEPVPAPAPAPEAAPAPDATAKQDLRDALNDLHAAKARVERDAARVLAETRRNLVRDLLPVLDNLDRSLAAGDASDAEARAVIDGVHLVRDQFEKVLRSYGVERIDAVGTRFDPSLHEAIAVVPTDDPARDNEVVDVWEPGYRMDDQVLRPAKVRVAKAAA